MRDEWKDAKCEGYYEARKEYIQKILQYKKTCEIPGLIDDLLFNVFGVKYGDN
jgi:hypothetical protein